MNTLISKLKYSVIVMGIIAGGWAQTSAAAENAFSVDYIHGEGDVDGVKLAYQYHTDWLADSYPNFDLYFETSVNFWEYGDTNRHDSNFVLAISPVLRYEVGQLYSNPLLVEFGIGVSLLDDTRFAGKDVSTHFQFEDRLGLVYQFGDQDEYSVSLRYFHYSNAGVKKPNPGLDFISLSLATRF